jgi:hypothetical protein
LPTNFLLGAGWMEILKRQMWCFHAQEIPKTTGKNYGGEDWQPGDIAKIALSECRQQVT